MDSWQEDPPGSGHWERMAETGAGPTVVFFSACCKGPFSRSSEEKWRLGSPLGQATGSGQGQATEESTESETTMAGQVFGLH